MGLSISDLLLRIRSDKGSANKDVDELAASLQALDHTKAKATAEVETDQLAFDALITELEAFDHKTVKAKAEVDTSKGEEQLQLFTHSLENLASKSFTGKFFSAGDIGQFTPLAPHEQLSMDLKIDPAKAEAELLAVHEQLQLELDALPLHEKIKTDKSVTTDVEEAAKTTEGIIQNLSNAFGQLASSGAGIGKMLGDMGEKLGTVTVNFGMFGARLGPVVAALLVFAVVLGTAIVAGLAALASSAILAATALAAMGVALAGALAPIALLAIPAMLLFGKVVQALATNQNTAAQAAQRHAQAVNQQIAAERAATAYAQQHADAERALAQAQQNLSQATVQAYRDMEDAINKVTEATNALADAQTAQQQSVLDFKKAKQALADFLANLGVGKKAFDSFFKTFQDVGFDPTKLNQALAKVKPPGISKDDELTLEQLILDITKARNGEADATESVKNAQTDLKRAREDEIPYLQKGIAGSKQYQAALQGVADAQRNLHRLEQQRADDLKYTAEQQAAQAAAAAAATGPVGKLSSEEKKLYDALKGLIDLFKKDFGPALDAMFSGLAAGLKDLGPAADKLKGPMTALGQALGGAIKGFIDLLASPASVKLFDGLIAGAQQLLPYVGKIFGPMFDLLGKIAQAAMPLVVTAFQALAGFLSSMDKNTTVKSLGDWLNQAFKSVQAIAGLIVQVVPAILDYAKQGAPWGNKLIAGLTGAAKEFDQWVNSKKGRDDIHNFFANTIPSLEKFATFLEIIAKWFITINNIATSVGDFFKGIWDFLNNLSSFQFGENPFQFILDIMNAFANPASLGPKVVDWGKSLATNIWDGVKSVGADLIGWILGPFKDAVHQVERFLGIDSPSKLFAQIGKDIWNGLIGGLKSIAFSIGDWVIGKFSAALSWLSGLPKKLFDLGASAISGLWNGIKSVAFSVANWLGGAFNAAETFLGSLPSKFFDLGKNIANSLWNGIKSIPGKVAGWFGDVVDLGKKILGIGSPSKVMMKMGQDAALGFQIGLDVSARNVQRAATKTFAVPLAAVASGTKGGVTIQNQNVNLPPAPGYDQMGDPRHQAALFAREMRRRGWR